MARQSDIIVDQVRKLAVTGTDLSSFAAEDAVETLLENWKEALRAEEDLDVLVTDVEGVIAHLQDFRRRVLTVYPEAQPRPEPMDH
jgi:hypothetical protein